MLTGCLIFHHLFCLFHYSVFIDQFFSLYPFCALTHKYVLGQPEVVIGSRVEQFDWRAGKLFFPNDEGIPSPVEGTFFLGFFLINFFLKTWLMLQV